ncbi:hypothetical protein BT69DRAFT_248748 [Atractiella rhizophila]|nr:hypothetical protein BT69DRAFT_248748 [Atractiella rhizophila]
MPLLSLPPEILTHILSSSPPFRPPDLLAFSLTSKYAQALIGPEGVLWRDVALGLWDFDGCESRQEEEGWKEVVKRFWGVKRWLDLEEGDEEKLVHFDTVLRTLLELVRTATPHPLPSKNVLYQFYFLRAISQKPKREQEPESSSEDDGAPSNSRERVEEQEDETPEIDEGPMDQFMLPALSPFFSPSTTPAASPIFFPSHIPIPSSSLRSQVHVLLGPYLPSFRETGMAAPTFTLMLTNGSTMVFSRNLLPYRGRFREVAYNLRYYVEPDPPEEEGSVLPWRHHRYTPLHADGTVNWTLVEGLHTTMVKNALDSKEDWEREVAELGGFKKSLRKFRGQTTTEEEEEVSDPEWQLRLLQNWSDRRRGTVTIDPDRRFLSALKTDAKGKIRERAEWNAWDWAGVEGIWLGSYAFVDYRMFHAFNFSPNSSRSLAHCSEAVGHLMFMELHLVPPPSKTTIPTSRQHSNSRYGYGGSTSSKYPTLYFEGYRKSFVAPTAGMSVHGCVRLAKPSDESPVEIPHWTLVSGYGGLDRWRSEGVQPGGIGARTGIVGNWSSAFDPEDDENESPSPVGPWIYWPEDEP